MKYPEKRKKKIPYKPCYWMRLNGKYPDRSDLTLPAAKEAKEVSPGWGLFDVATAEVIR